MTALRYPEREFVQVPALAAYYMREGFSARVQAGAEFSNREDDAHRSSGASAPAGPGGGNSARQGFELFVTKGTSALPVIQASAEKRRF